MQAPATPTGPPAQEPGERACPNCGAANGPLAAFCWQCYRQFGAASGSQGYQGYQPNSTGFSRMPGGSPAGMLRGPGYAPAPLPAPLPQAGRGRSFSARANGLWVMIAVAIGSFAVFHVLSNRPPDIALPASIGTLPQVENAQLDQALEPFRDEASAEGVDADMGFYGTGGFPTAALVWVDGSDVATSEDAWADFADGFNTGLGTGSLEDAGRTSQVVAGVTYDCAPITGTPAGGVCMWQEDGVFWILFDLSGSSVGSTQDLSVAAHDAVA